MAKTEYTAELKLDIRTVVCIDRMFKWGEREIADHDLPLLSNIRTWTVSFPNGCQADLKVNTSEDDIWSEVVLFDADGRQLSYTEPSYEIVGEWKFSLGDEDYTLVVKVK